MAIGCSRYNKLTHEISYFGWIYSVMSMLVYSLYYRIFKTFLIVGWRSCPLHGAGNFPIFPYNNLWCSSLKILSSERESRAFQNYTFYIKKENLSNKASTLGVARVAPIAGHSYHNTYKHGSFVHAQNTKLCVHDQQQVRHGASFGRLNSTKLPQVSKLDC